MRGPRPAAAAAAAGATAAESSEAAQGLMRSRQAPRLHHQQQQPQPLRLVPLLLALLLALALQDARSSGSSSSGRAVAMAFSSGAAGNGNGNGGGGRFPWPRWQGRGAGAGGGGGGGLGQQLGRRLASVRDALEGPYTLRQPQAQQDLVQRLLEQGPVPPGEREFLVNGWRWHARSVLRDVGRFQAVARRELQQPAAGGSRLPACFDFLWGFSWVALIKIEGELFYPFLRRALPKEVRPVLDELEAARRSVAELGASLGSVCDELREPSPGSSGTKQQQPRVPMSPQDRASRLDRVLALASEMEARARALVAKQEAVVVPVVAAYLPGKEQKRFNNKVISSLGLFNSRVHLVSMAEAVKGDPEEEPKFRRQIPSIAQAFVPRWREKLYRPLAQCLDGEGQAAAA